MEVWLHTFSFPGRVAELASQAEEWGFTGLLVADSQNLNADICVELALAGAATRTLQVGPGVTNTVTRHPRGDGVGRGDVPGSLDADPPPFTSRTFGSRPTCCRD